MPIVVAVIMILIALFLLESEKEKLRLTTCEYLVKTEKPVRLTVVFLSDLHDYLPARHDIKKITDAVDAAHPDVVFLGGDMITVSRYQEKPVPETKAALSLIGLLAEKYEVYYAEGNHEARYLKKDPEGYAAFVTEVKKFGVHYLAQESAEVVRKAVETPTEAAVAAETGVAAEAAVAVETGVRVYGVTLPDECFRPMLFKQRETIRLPEGFLEAAVREEEPEPYRIGLIHSPRYLSNAAEAGFDLVLSGHYHGGTIRLPDGSGLMTPQYQFFVKECSGVFTKEKTTMIVNRGLGTHSIKIRFNDIPEVSVIKIEGTDHLQT